MLLVKELSTVVTGCRLFLRGVESHGQASSTWTQLRIHRKTKECTHTHKHTCTYTHSHTCTYTHACIHTYRNTCTHIHTSLSRFGLTIFPLHQALPKRLGTTGNRSDSTHYSCRKPISKVGCGCVGVRMAGARKMNLWAREVAEPIKTLDA